MRQLFTCLLVVFLFAAALPDIFATNYASVPSGEQSFDYGVPSTSHPTYFADQKSILPAYHILDSQVASVSSFPLRVHLPNPIA